MEESSLFVQLLLFLETYTIFLSNQTKTNTSIKLVKITSIYQSASLIAQKISWKLKQKNSLQQIEKCQYVKGICIFVQVD
jgi:hypothetical protein